MAAHPRIEELRRRVEKDPASIAFAQLAEEHRRAGQHDEAVRVARAGLERYPTYLSARVTLGRALLELEHYDDAKRELEYVLQAAPDNLAAIRALAETHQRRGDDTPDRARAPHGAEDTLVPSVAPPDFASAVHAIDALGADVTVTMPADSDRGAVATPQSDPVLDELEGWLEAILADRAARGRA